LFHQFLVTQAFRFCSSNLLLFGSFNLTHHFVLLFNSEFTLLDAFLFTLGNLINNDLSSCALGCFLLNFTALSCMKSLETFNFHHKVKAFLFTGPTLLDFAVLSQLLVTNSNNL
jgi:hypothetical protein